MAAKKKAAPKNAGGKGKDPFRREYDQAVNLIAEYGMRGMETPRGDSRAMYKKFSAKKGRVTQADIDAVLKYAGSMQDLRRGRKR